MADDEATFRCATAALLAREGYAVRDAEDGQAALAMVEREPFDVLVADLQMEGNADLELVERLAAAAPELPTILVTGYPSLRSAMRSVALPVVAYLLKPVGLEELLVAVDAGVRRCRALQRLRVPVEQAGSGIVLPDAPSGRESQAREAPAGSGALELAELSAREREVVSALLQGHRVSTIAHSLGISAHTVRNHLKSVFRKLDVHSQAALVESLRPLQRSL